MYVNPLQATEEARHRPGFFLTFDSYERFSDNLRMDNQ